MSSHADNELVRATRVFNAMGNLVRLRILTMVVSTKKPLHIRAVARGMRVDYAAIYRHVSVLRAAKLIEIYEVGRSRVLAVNRPDAIKELVQKTKDVTT